MMMTNLLLLLVLSSYVVYSFYCYKKLNNAPRIESTSLKDGETLAFGSGKQIGTVKTSIKKGANDGGSYHIQIHDGQVNLSNVSSPNGIQPNA